MITDKFLRILCICVAFILDYNTTINATKHSSLQGFHLLSVDTTEVDKLRSEENFNPVTPTIPDNPQQSFNSNDFPDPEYKQYPLPPDVSSAMDYPVVCTPVNTSVSPIGAATFSVPIEGPQGVGLAVPQLAIFYNSMQGNGILGLGCSVSGLSAITRSVRDIYHDRNAGRLSFNEYDALRLDNNRFDEWNTTKYKYSADGNILSFPVAGNYTYSQEKPHAVIGVTNLGGKIPSTAQDIDYNDINKTDRITEEKSDGLHTLDFYYGPDNERWIAEYQTGTEDVKSVHYGDSYEKVEECGNVREITYLGNGLLYYRENGGQGKLLYMFTDAQSSITDIFDADGSSVFQAEYDPWGNMTVTKNDIGFIRGYTGHEMLPEFGLINMNGRMYDPQLGRFLSPDNYIQMPENSQNFNRYSYCLNNPLKYTDPSGELFGIDDLFVFLAGGAFNVIGNAVSGDIKSFWHGAELFAVGGAAALATEYASPAAGAVIIGAGNSIVNQGNTKGWGNISWSEVGTSTIMSCLTSAAGQYLTSAYSNLFENVTGGISNEILKNTLNQSIANSLSGFTLSSAMSLASGEDWNKALGNGLHSAAEGALVGAASGYMQGIYEQDANTKQQNFEALDKEITPEQIVSDVLDNPLTPEGTGTNSVYIGRDNKYNAKYVGITQRRPQERFSEHLRSKSNRSTLFYEPIQNTGNLSRRQALIIEQRLVNLWKMDKNGGTLYNKINPIAPHYWNKYGIK